jgi:hypothetical protein
MSKTILAVLAGLMLSIGIAHADPADAYLAELQRRGVDYSTASAAITLDKASCNALREGNSVMAVLKTIEEQGEFSGHDSGVVVGAAGNTFCPDQLSTVEGFIANHGG